MKKQQSLIIFLIIGQIFLNPSLVQYRSIENDYVHINIPSITDVSVGSYIVPGVIIPPSNLVKIGIIGDMEELSGIQAWKGAFLAAKEINQQGGISINGSTYYIGLVSEDTDEENPNLVISLGIAAAERMVYQHSPDFVVGGYTTESLLAYQEVFMDNQIPFFSIGSSTDIFCQNVHDNYARYKYFFRTMPINSTGFASEFLTYLLSLSAALGAMYGGTVNKVAILREDLTWTAPWSALLNAYLPLFGLIVVEEIAFPIDLTPADMASHMQNIADIEPQIMIPMISGQAGILMMQQYQTIQPTFLVVGMDRHSQLDSFWEDSSGSCQYEIIPQFLYNTNKTSQTLPFWNSFLDAYDEDPFYTASGAYDSINLLIDAVSDTQSLNSEIIVNRLEAYNSIDPFHGASGLISFTNSHDLVEGWPYSTYLFCQWNSFGTKEVLTTYNMVYPNSITTGSLKIPPWGIYNLTGPQAIPGGFSLSSDASSPDTDGTFNLTWSSSSGATSYSIYYRDQPSSRRFVKIADGAVSPFEITNLMTDEYYFVVVAHNSVGESLSNNHHVNVERPRPGDFTLYADSVSPDSNGKFNLFWSVSEGADNYSIYMYDSYITQINQSHTILADQTGVSPYYISGLPEGQYYFAVEAHNETGKTLSNCLVMEVDLPGPGSFTLTSDAGTPDQDGEFDLTWTTSEGADSYSIYRHYSYITDINLSITLLADQSAVSPFSITGLTTGNYYFVAVSYNETGSAFSNNIYVTIQIPQLSQDIPAFNIVLSLFIISVISTITIFKLRKRIKTIV